MTDAPSATPALSRSPRRPSAKQRRAARERAVQALYQQLLNRTPIGELESQFMEDPAMLKIDLDYFRRLVRGVSERYTEIDQVFEPYVSRPLAELDPVEYAVLRLGVFELKYCPDVPLPVVLNESIELAKRFGATDGHKFVNGVLDKAAATLRSEEVITTRQRRRDRN